MHPRFAMPVLVAFIVAASLAVSASAGGHTPTGRSGTEVTVRVEGKTRTIFGSRTLTPFQGSLHAADDATVEVVAPTPLGALESASLAGEFNYNLRLFSFGSFVDRIARFGSGGSAGWFFKVNGAAPEVGAGDVVLESGDSVLWYWAKLDPKTFDGPDTLNLIRKRGCLIAQAVNAKGKATRARKVVFRFDNARRRIRSKSGRFCATNWQTAQVVKRGHVRSQVLRAK